jgi:prepilin-type N-terminal cleavage/methylation domain-containing protein
MKLIPTHMLPRLAQAARGMTITELMVAIAVGSLVLMFMTVVFSGSLRCFAATSNYVNMNNDSRNALDTMTRDIRQAGDLTGFTSTRLQFTKYGTTNLLFVYEWDANSHQLTQWQTGIAQTNVLLTDCDELAFSMYKTSFAPAANVLEAKSIGVAWKCSRTVLGKKANTEDMQQALIVIRNKRL